MGALITIEAAGKKMSSREIAELMEKRHSDVLRDVKGLISQGAINERNFALVGYKDAKGEKRPEYLLDFDATMILITGYDAKRRSMVIKRWRELDCSPEFAGRNYSLGSYLDDNTQRSNRTPQFCGVVLPGFKRQGVIAAPNFGASEKPGRDM